MLRNRVILSPLASWGVACAAFVIVPVGACTSDNAGGTPDSGRDGTTDSSGSSSGSASGSGSGSSGGSGSSSGSTIHDGGSEAEAASDSGADAAFSTCASPGMPTSGPVDDHCALPEGGMTVQPTDPASCHPDAAAVDGGASCSYGATMFGKESDDDDCKYHLKWSSTPICESSPGVIFTVVTTYKTASSDAGAGAPLTGANPGIEAFTTTPGDWDSATYCDTASTHPSFPPRGGYWPLTEGPPGTYTGPVKFDLAGQWTVRFHFNQNCDDTLPTSPHGHAAYHITVP